MTPFRRRWIIWWDQKLTWPSSQLLRLQNMDLTAWNRTLIREIFQEETENTLPMTASTRTVLNGNNNKIDETLHWWSDARQQTFSDFEMKFSPANAHSSCFCYFVKYVLSNLCSFCSYNAWCLILLSRYFPVVYFPLRPVNCAIINLFGKQ